MSNDESLLIKQVENILTIKLNRPDFLNAFTLEMKIGIKKALDEAKSNPQIRAVLLTGAGRCFCAGGDIKGMEDSNPISAHDYMSMSTDLILTMSNIEIPIIAVVNGIAAGGGAALALASDIILAAEDSRFIFSFSKVGLIPDNGASFFLPRLIGLYRTKEILFKGGTIDARKAYEWGLVNELYPSDSLEDRAIEYTKEIACGPSKAIGQIKKLTNMGLVNGLENILELERSTQAVLQSSSDHREGVQAFKEKRKPLFLGY